MRRRPRKKTILFGVHAKLYARIALAAGVLLTIIIIALISSSKAPLSDAPEVSRIQRSGILYVGIYRNELLASSGSLDVELGKRIAKRIFPDKGDEAVGFIELESSMVKHNLDDGTIDIAIMLCDLGSANKKYVYSEPYYSEACVLAVGQSRTKMYINGANIGTINGSSCAYSLDSYVAEKGIEIRKTSFASYDLMLLALGRGDIDGAVMTETCYLTYKDQYGLAAHDEELGSIDYAVVCSAESPMLVQIANEVIEQMRDDGVL